MSFLKLFFSAWPPWRVILLWQRLSHRAHCTRHLLQNPGAVPPQDQVMTLFGCKWWASCRPTIGSCYISDRSEAPDSFDPQGLGLFVQSVHSTEGCGGWHPPKSYVLTNWVPRSVSLWTLAAAWLGIWKLREELERWMGHQKNIFGINMFSLAYGSLWTATHKSLRN